LRTSPSMLDEEEPSDNVSGGGLVSADTKDSAKFGFLLRGKMNSRQHERSHAEESPDTNTMDRTVLRRIRSKDRNFNSIRFIFESKRTPPIVPPNESVR
jgi:hypothetical protein